MSNMARKRSDGKARPSRQAMRDQQTLAEIEDFIEGFNQPTYRGMRVNAPRVATGALSTGGRGMVGPMRSGHSEHRDDHPTVTADTGFVRAGN